MSIHDCREELIRLVSKNIEREYNELSKMNDFPKDHMWINIVWIKFVKDSVVKIDNIGPATQTKVTPIIKYVPNPRSGIEDIKFPSRIFDRKNFEFSLCDLDDDSKQRILVHLPKLIVTGLESNRMEIPSKSEINENLNNNIEGFLSYVEHKGQKIRSIAPVNRIEFDDCIISDGVRLRTYPKSN